MAELFQSSTIQWYGVYGYRNIYEYVDALSKVTKVGQCTDTKHGICTLNAQKGQLRPKNPHSGEKSISEMFSKPYVKELDKEKKLEENCV